MDLNNDSTNDSDVSMASISGAGGGGMVSQDLLSNSAIKIKIISGEFKLVANTENLRSKVWNTFSLIENQNGETFPNLVACKFCFSVYKLIRKSTSNLVKHKCYIIKKNQVENSTSGPKVDVENEHKKKSICLLTQWTIVNCRPFKIVEDSGLKEFVHFLIDIGAKYGSNVNVDNLLPHPTTVARNIHSLYDKYFKIIKDEVISVKKNGFSLTSDLWTDNYLKTTYLSLTIHYIKDGLLINRLLGMKSMKGESCTGQNIKTKISNLLSEFDCEFNENVTIVTDRGRNMIVAFCGENHLFCINHLLHNTVEKALRENQNIFDLCNSCTKLVKYFKKSALNSELNSSLKSFVCTRWNTFYYVLDSIEKNWAEITNILQQKNELNRIANINLTSIQALAKILRAFEEASKKLEGEKYATIHLSIVHIHRLKKICASTLEDSEHIAYLKISLQGFLDTIVLQNLKLIHRIGLFLFPPANKLIQFNETEKNEIRNEVLRELQLYFNYSMNLGNEGQAIEQILNVELPILPTDATNLFADFLPQIETPNHEDAVATELQSYESTLVGFTEDFNVLQWWHLHRLQFPLLYKLSCKILATPASSSSSERTFSAARQLISERRSLIGADPVLVNKIMFLHSNVNQTIISKDLEENISL